ncbi:hypothetical protein STRDD10_01615 [Streptococcus sp. DD10]|uniref:helix-turn-helix domain-containing protein n=1 Tax=Streptococcus sp. DD10 TaxID=1777878 RepID=UPI000792568F|nr:helix-turn-helix transcriptional regulator [Streptococcus sp. DD10]KXT73140.1 hypothetical protein STRDD10_01615 [Streptococcus sp. DD10]
MLWEKIKPYLTERGWTSYRLAKESGLATSLIYNLEHGKNRNTSFDTMCKIADALDVSLDEFR